MEKRKRFGRRKGKNGLERLKVSGIYAAIISHANCFSHKDAIGVWAERTGSPWV